MKLPNEKVIVIDGPAGLGEVTRSTLLVADVALIPCGPSVLDIHALIDASAERRKARDENWSQQDIVAEALEALLEA